MRFGIRAQLIQLSEIVGPSASNMLDFVQIQEED